VCVCVCVCEREREMGEERKLVGNCLHLRKREREKACVFVCERERNEREWVWESVCIDRERKKRRD
jgi:hypothetical protein